MVLAFDCCFFYFVKSNRFLGEKANLPFEVSGPSLAKAALQRDTMFL